MGGFGFGVDFGWGEMRVHKLGVGGERKGISMGVWVYGWFPCSSPSTSLPRGWFLVHLYIPGLSLDKSAQLTASLYSRLPVESVQSVHLSVLGPFSSETMMSLPIRPHLTFYPLYFGAWTWIQVCSWSVLLDFLPFVLSRWDLDSCLLPTTFACCAQDP